MGNINQSIRDQQRQGGTSAQGTGLVAALSASTGVAAPDVTKVLDELGLSRAMSQAVRMNNGQEPLKADTRLAFRIGRNTVVF